MYDFLLVTLLVTLAVSATVFEILTIKARKSLYFCDQPLGLPDGEEIMPLAFFVLTQYRRVTDRRTDRHVAVPITIRQ